MAVTLFGAFFIVFFNTLVDIAYAKLDPRVRLGESAHAVSGEPLLSVRDLAVAFATEDGRAAGGRRRLVRPLPGRGAGDRRRVGLGQERHRADDHRPDPLAQLADRGLGRPATAPSWSRRARPSCSKVRGERIGDGLPGPDDLASTPSTGSATRSSRRSAPTATIGDGEARELAVEMLDSVGIPDPQRRVDDYPHEFSGGMRQRAMIAMALALEPEVLIADEPTTALDVTVQAQILDLLERLNRERDLATILITHDLGVVAEVADRVLVMYAGRVVEEGTLDEIFYDPQHPYTWGLLGSLTRLDRAPPAAAAADRRARRPRCSSLDGGCAFRPRCPHAFDDCAQLPGLEARLAEAPGPPATAAGSRPSRSASAARSRGGSGWRRRRERARRRDRCSRSPTWSSTSRSSAGC